MEIITYIIANYQLIGSLIGVVILWYKRDFLGAQWDNLTKQKQTEATTSDIIEKNLGLYQKMLDDYAARKEAEDIKQVARIEALEHKVEALTEERTKTIKQRDELLIKLTTVSNQLSQSAKREKELTKKVDALTNRIEELSTELRAYKEHFGELGDNE